MLVQFCHSGHSTPNKIIFHYLCEFNPRLCQLFKILQNPTIIIIMVKHLSEAFGDYYRDVYIIMYNLLRIK